MEDHSFSFFPPSRRVFTKGLAKLWEAHVDVIYGTYGDDVRNIYGFSSEPYSPNTPANRFIRN